jgi:hypothetical protein
MGKRVDEVVAAFTPDGTVRLAITGVLYASDP